ncbi:MAG: hypothetical protein Q4B70_12090, partial [Lachnospiraceae bacterium]|nr:hypothetical protein [Lachnospiraceae bacterium]
MPRFNERIRELIEESGYTVYQIAKGAGIGRTSIHKMMAGTLVPSHKFMDRFYQYMRLLPAEKQELEQLYIIEKDGKGRYENRIFIKKMLERIAGYYELIRDHTDHRQQNDFLIQDKGYQGIKTMELIYKTLKEELDSEGTLKLDMNIPFGNSGLYDLIYWICKEYGKDMDIRQLVILNQNPEKAGDANYNLKILHKVLPMAFASGSRYQVRRCYSRCSEKDYYAFFWPYYMITKHAVIMISADGNSVCLAKEEELVSQYQNAFETAYDGSDLLLEQYHDPFMALRNYMSNYETYGMPDFVLENKPCLSHMYSRDILNTLLGPRLQE